MFALWQEWIIDLGKWFISHLLEEREWEGDIETQWETGRKTEMIILYSAEMTCWHTNSFLVTKVHIQPEEPVIENENVA